MLRCLTRVATVTAGGALGVLGVLVPAQASGAADEQITIRGAGFPETRTAQLSLVGCDSLYDRGEEVLAPFIGRGPGRAPMGERSLGYDLAGGNAVGSLHYVDSMATTTTAALSVHAAGGADGVAYAGFQDLSDAATTRLWIGRAPLSAPPGAWTAVEATALTYSWTQYDMVTHVPVPTVAPAEPSTVADFAADHGGDGAGFYSIGFGCDGSAFNMDAWQVGGPGGTRRYDLEGLATTTTIEGSVSRVAPGEPVRLTGRLRLGRGDRMRSGSLLLESRPAEGGPFAVEHVLDADEQAGDPEVVVRPSVSMVYRFRFAGRPMSEASESALFVVTVLTGEEEPPPLPDLPDPSEDPRPTPDRPGDGPTDAPQDDPQESPEGDPPASETPEPPQSEDPGGTPDSDPDADPSGTPTADPSGSPDASPTP